MIPNSFTDRLIAAIRTKGSILIVGLDPQLCFIPHHILRDCAKQYGRTHEAIARAFLAFNMAIIDMIVNFAIAVKPQIAFYELYGSWGIWAFEETIAYARKKGLVVITDGKRGDGGDTADAYAAGHIGEIPFWGPEQDPLNFSRQKSTIRVEALTVHGYIAEDCVSRFIPAIKDFGTGIFVVDKTSFKPNSKLEQLATTSGLQVWQELALMVKDWGKDTEGEQGYRNLGVVMGATYPKDAIWMRETLPNSWFLVPGFGGQGATADDAVRAVNGDGFGCGVNSSRDIIFAYRKERFKRDSHEFALAARNAAVASRDDLNAALKRAGKTVYETIPA
jgi:orotidine-5'-phosphate decarboxylase